MPVDPEAVVTWPGITRVFEAHYAAAVGVTPGVATLTISPLSSSPTLTGTLVLGIAPGGVPTTLTLTDCHVAPNGLRESRSRAGRTLEMLVYDRRWRWTIGPPIFGEYNQRDSRGKLIPWTVRSPYQLARLCLQEMGEDLYLDPEVPADPLADPPTEEVPAEEFEIDLPPGLAGEEMADPDQPEVPADPEADPPVPYQPARYLIPPAGPDDEVIDVDQGYLDVGENVAQTGTNPPTSWNGLPAAHALQALCELYGRTVVWQPRTNKTSVQTVGVGDGLPEGAVLSASPAIDPKMIPEEIAVYGAPTRYQCRLRFRAVGRDWDESWQTPGELTYAPTMTAQKMKTATSIHPGAPSVTVTVNGVEFTGQTLAISDAINASTDKRIDGKVTASSAADINGNTNRILVVTGDTDGYEFSVSGDDNCRTACVAGPIPSGKGYVEQVPPLFARTNATERLSYPVARQLAESSVHSCFQLVCVDPGDFDVKEIPIPELGSVTDRFKLIVQNKRADQIVPRAGDETRIDPATGQPFAAEQYNGYSLDRSAAAFASIYYGISAGGFWANTTSLYFGNTPPESQIYIPFTVVDPERQVIQFSRPVYRLLGGERTFPSNESVIPSAVHGDGRAAVVYCDPVIETAVIVLDDVTGTPKRFVHVKELDGGLGPRRAVVKEDVQLEVIGEYSAAHALEGFHRFDADAENRAEYYADELAKPYVITGSFTATYTTFRALDLSGVVRQVGWSLTRGGWTTFGAANNEPNWVVVPYPERRRRELLQPDALGRLQALASQPEVRNALDRFAAFGAAVRKTVGL